MTLPNFVRGQGERIVKSFNFIEEATGQAFLVLYGGETQTGGILSGNEFYSDEIVERISGEAEWTTLVDKDYDVIIGQSIRVNDTTATVTVTMGAFDDGGGDTDFRITASVIHYDGTTETILGTATSSESTFTLNNNTRSETKAISISLSRKTFKKGETLRLSLLMEHKGSDADYAGFGQDPKDRNDNGTAGVDKIINDSDTTQLVLNLPIRTQ